jgi:acyl-coenzyme A synthetase/AMP-(fatty) acid ligase
MVPRRTHVLRDLPLNLNGKIDRVALSALEG